MDTKIMTADIRVLTVDDWAAWKDIRLEAVKRHPEAFSSAYEDEVQHPDENFRERLVKNTIFGAFCAGMLVGVAGFYILPARKTQHRGIFFGMYLKEEFRGQGIADQLIRSIIAHAKSKVVQLHCSAVTTNTAAVKLYQKHGFKIYGTEPRSLKVENDYHDEHLMFLALDEYRP